MAVSLDSILKLPTLHKLGILALISVFIVGAYWQGFYRQAMRRVESKESKLADLTREMNIKRSIAKDLDKFKEELASMNTDLQAVLTKLPDKKEIPNLLKSISNMSKEAGLEVLLFKPQGEQSTQFYARVPVELQFVGSYHKIGMFFYYVGTLPRIVNIENFSIKNAQKKSREEFLLSTSCVASTYRYKESAPPPAKKGK
jgi:type IV pilus assembly protein PilO